MKTRFEVSLTTEELKQAALEYLINTTGFLTDKAKVVRMTIDGSDVDGTFEDITVVIDG